MKTTNPSFQQFRSDACVAGDEELVSKIDVAWNICEGIDYLCEWGDVDAADVVNVLADFGHAELADFLRARF